MGTIIENNKYLLILKLVAISKTVAQVYIVQYSLFVLGTK